MFDRYDLHHHNGPSHVTVEEKRAPTDASVALLREMEEKARGQVVEAMRLTSASLEAVVQRYDGNFDLKTHFLIHYKLNGQQREVKLTVDYKTTIHERLQAIWKEVAEDIASVLVNGIVKEVAKYERY